MMEIELKYDIPSEAIAEEIWDNRMFKGIEEDDSREEMCFEAKYFDTESCDLAKNEIAYRVRHEGNNIVASLKWKGHSEDGLHVREEINVPVDSDEPDISVFRQSNIGCQVQGLLHDRELRCFLETKVNRRSFRIDTGKGIYEFSIDSGEIITEFGTEEIHEVEIELFSGETDELVEIGKKLQKKYELSPENESKYARGVKIIKENKQNESD